MKFTVWSILLLTLAFAGKPYQDAIGAKFWRFEMQEVKDDPDAVEIVPYSRTGVYKRLFYKKNDEVKFKTKYDLVRTIDEGFFHQGNFWEAYYAHEHGGKGKYHLPGFEKLKDGCDIIIYLRYTKWVEDRPYQGKDTKCVIGNSFSTLEEGVRRAWTSASVRLARKVWRKFAFDLPEGTSELVVEVNDKGIVEECSVEFEGARQELNGLDKLCREGLEGPDGYSLYLSFPLDPSTWKN